MGGAFMENFIVSEIRKSFLNAVFDAPLYFYRNRGGKEVDLVLECDGGLYPIEIKKTASSNVGMTRPFATLDKSAIPRPPRGGGRSSAWPKLFGALDANTLVVPDCMI